MDSRQRVLVLPGAGSPFVVEAYRKVYEAIEIEARQRGAEIKTVIYPGQGRDSHDQLTFKGAVEIAQADCRRYRPDRLICRSFGTLVAAQALSSEDEWVKACDVSVFWGPRLGSKRRQAIPPEQQEKQIRDALVKRGTRLAPDFYHTLPGIEELIGGAKCKLLIVRGSLDEYNTKADLEKLKTIHDRDQGAFGSEVIEIPELPHEVLASEVSPVGLAQYFSCLFEGTV
jgi:hypothetical protein